VHNEFAGTQPLASHRKLKQAIASQAPATASKSQRQPAYASDSQPKASHSLPEQGTLLNSFDFSDNWAAW